MIAGLVSLVITSWLLVDRGMPVRVRLNIVFLVKSLKIECYRRPTEISSLPDTKDTDRMLRGNGFATPCWSGVWPTCDDLEGAISGSK